MVTLFKLLLFGSAILMVIIDWRDRNRVRRWNDHLIKLALHRGTRMCMLEDLLRKAGIEFPPDDWDEKEGDE